MTSTKKHHKHPPLVKPALGEWGRNEIAFLGAPCGIIEELTNTISARLSPKWNKCYVDADHAEVEDRVTDALPGAARYTDKIHSKRIDFKGDPSQFQRRHLLSGYDIVLVNGNHFTAAAQIVFLHSKKIESLQRKTDRLTNVVAVVELDVKLDACPFLKPFLTNATIFSSGSEAEFLNWLNGRIVSPGIQGLVLAGGKSLRMGTDKSDIAYHGMPQVDYVTGLFDAIGIPAYVSCRPDQIDEKAHTGEVIQDRFLDLGPFGAILSAMMSAPDNAWLVVATDLPLISTETLNTLISSRDCSKIATAFHNPDTGFPEPLITLWEPKAYPVLLSYLAQGIACPRKTLINSDVNVIAAADVRWLQNVNTPEEAREIQLYLQDH